MVRVGVRLMLRPMHLEDLPIVVALERATYPQPWSEQIFRDELAQVSRHYLVAEDESSRVVGFAGVMLVAEEAHITTVAVDASVRGRQIGTRLMLALVDHAISAGARHLTLEVRVSNTAAQELYRRFGMAPVGFRKNYYGTEDALVMWANDLDRPEYGQRLAAIRERLDG